MSIQRSSRSDGGEEAPVDASSGGDGAEGLTSGVQRVAKAWTGDAAGQAPQRSRAGWTVLEEYERDGFCYQVLRRPLDGDAPRLTKREEQVLARACEGESNKSIAHDLGLSPSTVGVLLFRAAAKLGAGSRQELIAAYARLSKRAR